MFGWLSGILHVILKTDFVDFGEHITVGSASDFGIEHNIATYDWRDLVSISFEFDVESGHSGGFVTLPNVDWNKVNRIAPFRPKDGVHKTEAWGETLKSGEWRQIDIGSSPSGLANLLFECLNSADGAIRESAVIGLGKLGCAEHYTVTPIGRLWESYDEDLAQVRKDIAGHLEKVRNDPHQGTRNAVNLALSYIRRRISEERA